MLDRQSRQTLVSTDPHSSAEQRVDASSIVVYTAITGDYDSLKEQPATAIDGIDLVAFLDATRQIRETKWQRRILHHEFADQSRNAKIHKIRSHLYFPDKIYSLWIDGSVTINFPFPIEQLVAEYLADCDLALFRHYRRTCVYQEAGVALHRRLDDPATIRRQIEAYTREGYPANAGLSECCVLLRRHTDAIKNFNEVWWEEIRRGSRRDQLSFDYAARRCGLKYRYFPGSIEQPDSLFRRHHHQDQPMRALTRRGVRLAGRVCEALVSPIVLPVVAMLGRYQLRHSAGEVERARSPSFANASTDFFDGATFLPANPAVALPTCAASQTRGLGLGSLVSPAQQKSAIDSVDASGALPRSLSSHSFRAAKRVIAFGPERDFPSWDWVGFDTSRELSKYYQMVGYNVERTTPPDCDVLFIIKVRPSDQFIGDARHKGSRIVYCPIDFYESEAQLASDADFLRSCDMVLVHSERLLPLVRSYCPNSHFVEHHSRYSLPEVAEYKENGFVLWVGGCQYLAYLIGWLEQHPIGAEVKILTDIDKAWSRRGARRYASISLSRKMTSIGGCEVYPWSEKSQFDMLRECKAAIDLKQIEIFNQFYKPPTKAQKYIGSGIPFAVNPGSYSAEYFRTRGFVTASPSETDRWFSRDYFEETRRFGLKLREYTSLEAVGRKYRELIELLL